ncbi:MAG: D-alanyl-D-alanine carboxypeptidase/D-alanyl-D-alanine-endopeptidase [Acidimicrobiia bacterium]|nr:D-alanyl-D-alanine carboxypeptidase/D-alanyl-D-alanine-endopeptidase [Acidimicrobiia bacterium]
MRSSPRGPLVALLVAGLAPACAKVTPVAPTTGRDATLAQLQQAVSTLIDQPGHRHASWGIVVESLTTGRRLVALNPDARFVPASTLKVITAAVALAAVGPDYRFRTTASAAGPVVDGTLRGDLVLEGDGDPSLEGRGGVKFVAPLIAALRARGILRIDGRIVGHDDRVEEPRPGLAWSWDDLGTASGALAGALNIRENTTRVTVRPASTEGSPPRLVLEPEAAGLLLVNRAVTAPAGSPRTLWAERHPVDAGLTIAGDIAAGAPAAVLTVAVGNPTLAFAQVIRAALIGEGIQVRGAAADVDDLVPGPMPGEPLVSVESPPLSELIRPVVKDSVNMYAEAILRLATGADGPRATGPAIEAARARLEAWGVAPDTVWMADGSGLSRHNQLTPAALAAVLARVYDPSGWSPLMAGLPVAGVDGSLEARMTGTAASGNARAKTGSMTHVRTLAGYVTTAGGEPLAFAILANHFEGSGVDVTSTIDRIVARLASIGP